MPNRAARAKKPDDQGWDKFYGSGPAPWEDGAVCHDILDTLSQHLPPPKRILEVGAGTGLNAIALARAGYQVTALDIAPTALALARKSARSQQISLTWRLADFLTAPIPKQKFHALFDRAVFHVFRDKLTSDFAKRAADSLLPDGLWITLCGNCDDRTPNARYPKVSLTSIAAAVEPFFEILDIRRSTFPTRDNRSLAGWTGLFRKRPG